MPGRRPPSCVEASRRYGLATEPVAHLWLAGAHALAGDDAAMEASLADALARDPDDPRILGDLHGRVLVTRAFVADDLESLQPHLDSMMVHVDRAPPGCLGLPRAVGCGRPCTRRTTTTSARRRWPSCQEWAAALGMPTTDRRRPSAVEAVVRGRHGDHEAAADLVEQVRITRDEISIGAGDPALASRSWCRWRRSATGGAIPRPGCGSPRRSSRPGATSAPPAGAGP